MLNLAKALFPGCVESAPQAGVMYFGEAPKKLGVTLKEVESDSEVLRRGSEKVGTDSGKVESGSEPLRRGSEDVQSSCLAAAIRRVLRVRGAEFQVRSPVRLG